MTARAAIIEDGKLLVFRRVRRSRRTRKVIEYYSIPGGQIDANETPRQAAERELKEEMGVDISIDGMIGRHSSIMFDHTLFAAHIVNGRPKLALDSEENHYMHEGNQYHVEWVPVEQLTERNMRYYAPLLPAIQPLQAARGHQRFSRAASESDILDT